ncbi:lipase [Mycolicibacter engbaekii]|uniref:Lipase n=1 Tax=Mycolicibacter engbaekii TaxID=188915 RepID=A0A1X1U2G7_9MYCO|nr:alpha/beta hydrolase fold domain-containing protein [Mycolicibacter engbaekii]ORV50858.1 lipase [Mycolicibacter engbaekii]
MPEAGPVHPASFAAKLIYAVANAITPRLVRRLVLHGGSGALAERTPTMGRRINTLARLQRVRPFFRVGFTRAAAAGVPVEVVRRIDRARPLDEAFGGGAILYFHGGGFVTGGLDTHLHVAVKLARRTGLPVVHVDYRQYPEATVDGSVDDCVSAYRWLLDMGADPAKTVLAGDSAGGFLAFATALSSQQRGLPAAAGVIGISALLELDGIARSTHSNRTADAFGIPAVLPDIIDLVCPSPTLRHELSPINGPLQTMPPALLIAAESEILRCDAERLHDALLRAGRSSRLEVWARELHAFPALFPFLPDSRAAFALMVSFVAERLADAGESGQPRREVS